MSKQLYALVKWIDDDDNGTYTPGIPIEWIKNLNYEEFVKNGPNFEKVFAIEWHDSRKKPVGGWRCYDGFVVKISSRISKLEKAIDILSGTKSPKESPFISCKNNKHIEKKSSLKRKYNNNIKSSKKNIFLNMKEWDENIECAAKNQKIVSPNIPFNNSVTEILQDISGIEEFDNNITKKSEISNEMIFEATKRNYRLIQEMQKEIYNLKKSLQSTTERKKNYERDTSSNAENAEDKNDNLKRTNSDFERDDSMIEIGRKGSDVYLNKN